MPDEKMPSLSDGWVRGLLRKAGLKRRVFHGEAGQVDKKSVFRARVYLQRLIRKLLKNGYTMDDIWNLDETSFFFKGVPNRGFTKGNRSGMKEFKERITMTFACSAAGEKRHPIIISSAAKHQDFPRAGSMEFPGFYYNNKNSWMTGVIFGHHLCIWDAELKAAGRKMVLLVDNFSGHKVPEGLERIKVIFLPPNMTSHIQPLDAGIISCVKAIYKRKFLSLFTRQIYRLEFDKIYEMSRYNAIKLMLEAWNELQVSTIVNCWRHVQILPDDSVQSDIDLPVDQAVIRLETLVIPELESEIKNIEVLMRDQRAKLAVQGEEPQFMSAQEFVSLDDILLTVFTPTVQELVDELRGREGRQQGERVHNQALYDRLPEHGELDALIASEIAMRRYGTLTPAVKRQIMATCRSIRSRLRSEYVRMGLAS